VVVSGARNDSSHLAAMKRVSLLGLNGSFIACALGNAACRQGFRTRYYRVPRLLRGLELARADAPLTAPGARDNETPRELNGRPPDLV
jgi:DNA replication protein DnaC